MAYSSELPSRAWRAAPTGRVATGHLSLHQWLRLGDLMPLHII
jgi:hypothetical protein